MSANPLSGVEGLLLDLDGVLYIENRAIDGAIEAVEALRRLGIPCRYTTNTTTKSLESLYKKLAGMGLPLERSEIFGVIRATQAYLRHLGDPSCYFLLSDDPMEDFREFKTNEENPDVVVIGDVGKRWDYDLMNKVFGMVIRGANMVALHKGRYWQMEDGLRMDIGAFVAGLEYVTGQSATVTGKPSESFFGLVLEDLGMGASDVAMIGDDIINDIQGAQKAGMRGVLVRTGKYRPELVETSDVRPDLIVDSIADIPALLGA